jgi:PE family
MRTPPAAQAAETRVRVGLFTKEKSMSFVTTQPEALSAAAGDLQGIGADLTAHNAAAASPTTAVAPAAADEVSALTAAQFTAHAQLYQAVSAQAAAIHEMFVSTLSTSAGSYAATEAANAVAAG